MSTIQTPQELFGTITALQRTINELVPTVNALAQSGIAATDAAPAPTGTTGSGQSGHQNFIRNGNLDHTRNSYLYSVDWT